MTTPALATETEVDTTEPKKTNPKKPKKYLRKKHVAERYDTTPRNVDRMAGDGRLPPPDLYIGQIPLWSEETLDASDQEAMRRGRA